MRHLLIIITVLGAASVFASPAGAAPPVLVSAGHVQRHPAATWTLSPGVKATVAEVATSPATSTDGYFFQENLKAFDVLQDTQTNWVNNSQLDPGVYYLHIAGIDEPCFYAGLCPVREFTQTATLVIEAPPPPPPPPPPPAPRPRYEATVRSVHPGAIRDGSRNWTYRGDTVRVRFRNAAARPGDGALYRVCYTKNRRLACRNGRIFGRLWDSWRAADHAAVGWLRGWSVPQVRRVHLADRSANRRAQADLGLRVTTGDAALVCVECVAGKPHASAAGVPT
jgi:hypothetical protein